MRGLILSDILPWPLHGGRQINTHHLLRSLVESGHEALLFLRQAPTPALLAQWPLSGRVPVLVASSVASSGGAAPARWERYFGIQPGLAADVARIAHEFQPDWVEACGLHAPLWMSQLPADLPRLWLAADEKFLFEVSQLKQQPSWRSKLSALRDALEMVIYERHCARRMHAAVMVAPADALLMRHVGGFRDVLLSPNGVDAAYFHPTTLESRPFTAAFWGRLDFPPNIQAVGWFMRKVWPRIRRQHPDARWRIIGRSPAPQLRQWCADTPGIDLIPDAPDIRPHVWDSSVAIFPVQSGSGIKNKLLEAAAMGCPILASPAAAQGCNPHQFTAWRLARSPRAWASQLSYLWNATTAAREMGTQARQWVLQHHDWQQGVTLREAWLQRLGRPVHMPVSLPGTRRQGAAA